MIGDFWCFAFFIFWRCLLFFILNDEEGAENGAEKIQYGTLTDYQHLNDN